MSHKKRTLVAIGGGEIRNKTTLEIDRYAADLARIHAGPDKRPVAVFVGTASHDSLPYFNSFKKTYTSCFDIKADLILLTKKDIPMEKILTKIEKADLFYVGGGDTLFLLDVWEKTGLDQLLLEKYRAGVPVAGLSAGAICWFSDIYTDSLIMSGASSDYSMQKGLGEIPGLISPHFNVRTEFEAIAKTAALPAYAIEDNAAIIFENELPLKTVSTGGKCYVFKNGVKSELA